MLLDIHLLFFGSIISLVDIATHRIYRAVIVIGFITICPLAPDVNILRSIVLFLIATPLFYLVRRSIGFGDYLLIPLLTIYAQSQMAVGPLNTVWFTALSGISLHSKNPRKIWLATRIAASPFFFLSAVIVSEIK